MLTLGVALLRRSASLVGFDREAKSPSIALFRTVPRPPGMSPEEALRVLLAQEGVPRGVPLLLALSPSDLACGDSWTLPKGMTGRAAAKIGAALCETRCASETIETVVMDSSLTDTQAQAVALDRGLADGLLRQVEGFRLVLVTAAPAAIALTFPGSSLVQGGERFESGPSAGWRAYPVDGSDDGGT